MAPLTQTCSLLLLLLAAGLAARQVAAAPLEATQAAANVTTKCIQVHAVFRHGARTPVGVYPNDPYPDPSLYEPFGSGHLTTHGRQLEYNLGRLFRGRYVGEDASTATLLQDEYATGVLRVRTSSVERTQESAASALAGMWPPGVLQQWPTGSSELGDLWFPIPYYTIPTDEDRALAGSIPCASRDLEYARVLQSPEYGRRMSRVLGGEKTIQYIEQNAGFTYNISDPLTTQYLYLVFSNLQCQEDLGFPLPAWSKQVYPEPLRSAANLALLTYSYTPRLRRQSFGDLTTWILNASANHDTEPTFHMYSAHDSTVDALIQIMHLEPQDDAGFGIPEFSACILAEVHQDDDGVIGFRFFYRREAGGPIVKMIPKDCTEFCPLTRLESLIQDELPRADESCDVPATQSGLVNAHKQHVHG